MSALATVALLLLADAAAKIAANCPEPPIMVGDVNEKPPPTVPPTLVSKKEIVIPDEHRRRKIEMEVTMLGTIDIDGNVGDVVVLSCKAQRRGKPVEGDEQVELCREFTRLAEETYRTFKWEPAMKRGEPVCVYHSLHVATNIR